MLPGRLRCRLRIKLGAGRPPGGEPLLPEPRLRANYETPRLSPRCVHSRRLPRTAPDALITHRDPLSPADATRRNNAVKRSREPPTNETARPYRVYLLDQLRFQATVKSGSPPGDSAKGATSHRSFSLYAQRSASQPTVLRKRARRRRRTTKRRPPKLPLQAICFREVSC
jgi:hypothetical protein